MEDQRLRALLEGLSAGSVGVEEALASLRKLPYEDLGFAKIDHHRTLRRGFPEVIFGQGKTIGQVVAIVEQMVKHSDKVLVTRVGKDCFDAVVARVPDSRYNELARTITVNRTVDEKLQPGIAVVSAGTADLPVAEEAVVTAELMGNAVERLFDVGVAGIHRLLNHFDQLQEARVVVAVAGMEGALPSVIGGLVSAPVIAVPTSVGYGANFGGLAALLAMLSSCSAGVAVVNIDNGFGAGYLAAMINRESRRDREV
ncbi:MAG: nickel pincer cofactor biosynthesis protein LarB [Dehalococcoidia bacterium]|nr:nickel pincer cofactor biosynthesis protein LarB [Dehalococcoidia bacterium]